MLRSIGIISKANGFVKTILAMNVRGGLGFSLKNTISKEWQVCRLFQAIWVALSLPAVI